MDSSPVLRQQSQKKICTDILRTKNEQNKMAGEAKPSKLMSASHPPNQNIENHDPRSSEKSRKAPVRPTVSRLPVLVKSLHLQTPSEFTQSHHRWEEKPLTGKAKSKKPCTRPVPFNLSQPKNTRVASKNQQPLTTLQTRTINSDKNVCISHLKAKSINSKQSALLKDNGKSTKGPEGISQKPGQMGPHKTSAVLFKPPSSAPTNVLHQNISAQAAVSADTCSDDMNLLSLNDASKTSSASQHFRSNSAKSVTDKVETFQLDPAALLSILRNEGVSTTGLVSASPQSKPYNYLPQRVSVLKSQQKAGPSTGCVKKVQFSPDPAALQSILQNEGVKAAGPIGVTPRISVRPSGSGTSIYTPQRVPVKKDCAETNGGARGCVKSVQFSPDPAALQSILQTEGVKAAGPIGVTPRISVRPSGRGTSIYTAQRVPVKKSHAKPNGGPVVVPKTETPLKIWTPQRVQDTRHQPMSSRKWHMSSQQSPYAITPGLKGCKTNIQPDQEGVVQRLFVDPDEQSSDVTDQVPETQAEQLPVQSSVANSHFEEMVAMTEANEDEEQERTRGGQPFIQASERESVIFFSTGKKLFRAPYFKKQEEEESRSCKETLPVSEPNQQFSTSVQTLHRDLIGQKSCAVNPAVAMLRKRLPPLEDLRLDEEVATYTSASVPDASGFVPPRPRCGNPLASILHFDESTRFVPISFDMSAGSPLHDR
ncbi:uncharacterized protein troap [Sphaeramia orbicularis]|uniref:uncharacterized protein troap n=1 Tax=Sphaeramia orbicularis TaxID=375764 RepID=UPI00117CB622|nr:uncharacterized protein LOC115423109 [Sphaeramia orbicularis]